MTTARWKPLKVGTRVRLNVPTINGNKGVGTVLQYDDDTVRIMLDSGPAECCRHEISVLRDQSAADQSVLRRFDEMTESPFRCYDEATDGADEAREP